MPQRSPSRPRNVVEQHPQVDVPRASNNSQHEDTMHPKVPSQGRRFTDRAFAAMTMGLTWAGIATTWPALAQQTSPPDPGDPLAAAPPVSHVGSLARYRPLQDLPATSWQEINQRANRAGGWRVYAREQLTADMPPAAPAAAPVKPSPERQGHESHAPR